MPQRNQPPTNLHHLQRLLTEFSKSAGGMPVGRARHLMAVFAICSLLDRHRDADGFHVFLVKGGSAMQIRFGIAARSTTDIDLVFRDTSLECLAALDNAFRAHSWQGFSAARKGAALEIKVPGDLPNPLRTSVTLQFHGRPFATVALEIATDVGVRSQADLVDGVDLGWFGFDTPLVPCLSIPRQIAQKIHACTDPLLGSPVENSRVRDVVDIWLLEGLLDSVEGLGSVLREVIEVFNVRMRHTWPPRVFVTQAWRRDYLNLVAESPGVPKTVEEAADYLRDLIDRVHQSGISLNVD